MEETTLIFSRVLRYGAPSLGLFITLLAWRQFRVQGIGLAVAGFALMLLGTVTGAVARYYWVTRADFTTGREIVDRMYAASAVSSAFSIVGVVIVVFAMRRLFSGASEEANSKNRSLAALDE